MLLTIFLQHSLPLEPRGRSQFIVREKDASACIPHFDVAAVRDLERVKPVLKTGFVQHVHGND